MVPLLPVRFVPIGKRKRPPPWGMLAVQDHDPLPILAIFLNSCNRLWRLKFTFFGRCCVPVRFRTLFSNDARLTPGSGALWCAAGISAGTARGARLTQERSPPI
jgi:hypothetical protein